MTIPTPPTIATTLIFGAQARSFRLFGTEPSRCVVAEVFSGKSYPLIALTGDVQTILDVGANVGAATVYFALNYPQAHVLSFEPSPNCFALLRENTADLRNVRAFPFGLSNRTAREPLFLGRLDEVTNSFGRSPANATVGLPVAVRSASEVMEELGIATVDILKLDTEGCEVPILQSLAPWLERTGLVYVEYHDAADRHDIDRLLCGTHLLCRGQIGSPHRGELCYVHTRRLPPSSPWNAERVPRPY